VETLSIRPVAPPSYLEGGALSTSPTPTPGGLRVMPDGDGVVPGTPGTFPYDGGPRAPVPMPRADPPEAPGADPTPMTVPRIVPIPEAREVSLPTTGGTGRWVYPAYGEQPRRSR